MLKSGLWIQETACLGAGALLAAVAAVKLLLHLYAGRLKNWGQRPPIVHSRVQVLHLPTCASTAFDCGRVGGP